MMVVWLFLAVPGVSLQSVIFLFPDHTHLPISCLKPQGIEPDIVYVASSSGPLPRFFKLCHGANTGPAWGSHVLLRLI